MCLFKYVGRKGAFYMNENMGTIEKEINFKEMCFFCLRRWRGIVVFILAAAVLAGGYKYWAVLRNNQIKLERQKLLKSEGMYEEIGNVIPNPNIESYQLSIESYEDALEKKGDYLKNSVIMQLDANHLQVGILNFYVEFEDKEDSMLDALVSAYRAYVTDGRLVERLQKVDNRIASAELQDLILFIDGKVVINSEQVEYFARPHEQSAEERRMSSNKESIEIQMSAPEQQMFQIRLIALDQEKCEAYIDIAKEAILEYSKLLQVDIAEHKLKILATTQTEQIDQTIQYYQNQILSDYIMTIEDLSNLRIALKDITEKEGETVVINASLALDDPSLSALRFAIVGAVLGAFLAIVISMLSYILSNRLQSLDSFEEDFGMELVAYVREDVGKKKFFGFLDRYICRIEAGAYGNIPFEEQVKIACANVKVMAAKNADLKNVMLAGTMAKKDMQDMCVRLAEDINEITFSDYKQIVFCAADLEELAKYDGILFIEKRGVSATELIQRERVLAECRNVKVLGTIVL